MESTTTTIIFFLFSIANFLSLPTPITAASSSPVTAVFAFGDSTLDSGNNNHLTTLCRSDHPPYGRDFPGQVPSGRFSNGKLATDFMVSQLGLKDLLPAYLDPAVTDQDLMTGASFASGGSGLDDLTATESAVLTMSTQLQYLEEALQRIEKTGGSGSAEASHVVENALFFIAAGTNDMVFNFYGLPTRSIGYSLSGYLDFLLQKLESIIKRLYKMGARRFAVTGLPPIGCLPVLVTFGSVVPSPHMFQRVCVDQQNVDSQAYNTKLEALTSTLQSTLQGAKVAYNDVYNPILDMITKPAKYGFEHTLEGCCGTGTLEVGPMCNAIDLTCSDPSKYLFWDAVHPTQAAYRFIAHNFMQTVLPRLVG
ncbi:GDSL esterase/lipase At2g40250 [Cornus florida]|uniref:GDSL esterase/lipase At2g40250 n=1 Tax=Cornus florida TaxID=4283 RepID=UPI0028A22A44|nr:GDSL esterase/lipase At2g40250 [Cornus florida]